jgi:DNA gyrase subunit A
MQLRTLAGLERKKIEDEYEELQKLIKELEKILSSEANILKVIREELEQIKEKYGDKRRTQIVKKAIGNFNDEDLIPDEEVVITLTKGNYIKRIVANEYRAQGRGGKGKIGMATKEEDVVEHVVQASTHDTVLFFTTLGRVFKLKVYEIPAASRTAKGQSIANVLSLSPEEKVTSLVSMKKDDPAKYLFMTTKNGTIKKTSLSDFANIRQSGIVAIKLDAGDKLSWVKKTTGEDNIIISTAMAQAIRFKESDARPMGRATRGVRGIRLRKDDTVVGMDVISGEDQLLLVIMENGYGKITKSNQFSSHNRGGVGIKAGVVTAKTGKAVDVRIIGSREDDVLIVSKQGQVIRLKLSEIPVIGRSTQGVRIMRMATGDNIASIALMPKPAELDDAEVENSEEKKTEEKKDKKPKA